MGIVRRRIDAAAELRSLQDLAHRVWLHDPALLDFEASFGSLAWQRGGTGRCRAFERDGAFVGWARLTPGYSRIRAAGIQDQAPPSLVWQVDPTDTDPGEVLDALVDWATSRSEENFATAHNDGDQVAEELLTRRGFVRDPTEPYSGYLRRRLDSLGEVPVLPGYRFVTMLELADAELRAEVHRLAWDGSTRTAADVEATMATWPYKPEFDFVAIADDGTPAASVLCWYDPTYTYGEIEPVGTAPAHRGHGVGSALIRYGLRRLRDADVTDAVVGARADRDYPVPRRLYESIGFTGIATQIIVRPSV